jgi:ribonuclease Z
VLITEATFLAEEEREAAQYGHITARRAAEFAREMNVRYLLLTHVSRRYREYDIIREAQAVFPATTVARDLDHFRIRRGGPLEKVIESSTS